MIPGADGEPTPDAERAALLSFTGALKPAISTSRAPSASPASGEPSAPAVGQPPGPTVDEPQALTDGRPTAGASGIRPAAAGPAASDGRGLFELEAAAVVARRAAAAPPVPVGPASLSDLSEAADAQLARVNGAPDGAPEDTADATSEAPDGNVSHAQAPTPVLQAPPSVAVATDEFFDAMIRRTTGGR